MMCTAPNGRRDFQLSVNRSYIVKCPPKTQAAGDATSDISVLPLVRNDYPTWANKIDSDESTLATQEGKWVTKHNKATLWRIYAQPSLDNESKAG